MLSSKKYVDCEDGIVEWEGLDNYTVLSGS